VGIDVIIPYCIAVLWGGCCSLCVYFPVLVVSVHTLCTNSLEKFRTVEMCVTVVILYATCIVVWWFVWIWNWCCVNLYAVSIVAVEVGYGTDVMIEVCSMHTTLQLQYETPRSHALWKIFKDI
jgi:hypothetical protein